MLEFGVEFEDSGLGVGAHTHGDHTNSFFVGFTMAAPVRCTPRDAASSRKLYSPYPEGSPHKFILRT